MTDIPENPFESFPPEVNQAVEGLLWLGHLEAHVKFAGHTFQLRTPKASEELEAALIAKEYIDSIGAVKANTWARIAASLIAVDGDEEFCPPIGPDRRQHIRGIFEFITSNWYWPVAVRLFDELSELERKQSDAIAALEDLSGRSLSTSWASSDSSTEPGPSDSQS